MDPQKKRFIVVIDDSQTVCKILSVVLSRAGHQVKTFQDPGVALREFSTGETPPPDVLFVDLILPRIDGYQVMKRIREHPKPIHIIVISRLGGIVDRLKARLAGANDYLVKPFKEQDVIALVEHYADSRPSQ
jgi:DNA-binding response OmpR family regulator